MRTILTIALAFSALPSFADTIRFEQAGWTDSAGPLTIQFTGDDADADGAITLGELSAFDASWFTPSGASTGWTLSDLDDEDGFFFEDPGSYRFFAQNPQYSILSVAFEGEALASVFDEFLFPVSNTVTPATAVPEPGSFGLLAAAAAICTGGQMVRRRQ